MTEAAESYFIFLKSVIAALAGVISSFMFVFELEHLKLFIEMQTGNSAALLNNPTGRFH